MTSTDTDKEKIMTVQTYRKKPVEVQAVQWHGDNADELEAFAGPDFEALTEPSDEDPEATAAVRDDWRGGTWALMYTGDWVIREPDGDLHPMRAAEFADTYEAVDAVPGAGSPSVASAISGGVVITGPTVQTPSYYGALMEYMALCRQQHGGVR